MAHVEHQDARRPPLKSNTNPATEDVITITDETVHICRRLVQQLTAIQTLAKNLIRSNDQSVQAALADCLNETITTAVDMLAEHERFMAIVDSAELSTSDLERVADLLRNVLTDSRSDALIKQAADLKSRLLPTLKLKGIRS